MKKLLGFLVAFCAITASAQAPVNVLEPTVLRVNYGDSSLELNLAPHLMNANSFQVRYRPYPNCPAAPQVSLQARFEGNSNWHNMTVQPDGVFRHSGFKLNAIKLLFKQYRYHYVDCELSIVGSL